jgi:AcrR family transcriptional regulator
MSIEYYDVLIAASNTEPTPFQPAPGRGQYDRRQPREVRLLEQRARLLSATALAIARAPDASEPTIGSVVTLAGVSRNTFYEYFDDLAHARAAAEQRAEHRLVMRLRAAEGQTRTPVERWRALSHAWMAWVTAAPADALLCLDRVRSGLSAAGRTFEAACARSLETLRSSGIRAQDPGARVTAVAAAGEVMARRFVAEWSSAAPNPPGLDAERERMERTLTDVAARLLR